ncbi:MAG: signal peptidase [Solirubrobacterales bacterium]|nr:signal peptidase [Solirubrobacterales bacterium]
MNISAKTRSARSAASNGAKANASGVKEGGKRSKSTRSSVIELVVIIAVALGLALGIQAWVVKPYRIPSGSMLPTLAIGQRVLVNRIGMDFSEPHVGEIAVFHPPRDAEQEVCGPVPHQIKLGGPACSQPEPVHSNVNFIKRIVAGPGDVISIVEGHVIRNGKRENDSYTKPCGSSPECNFPTPIKIPPGHWFMMGDNRGESDDSRFWGPVPSGWIIGGAIITYWPPDRIGIL